MNLDFAEWNRETIRNRIKSLKAAAAKAKAKAKATTTDNTKVKKKKSNNKRPLAEIVQKDEGRSSKLNNNMLKTELHDDEMTPSGKEFLGNDSLYDNGDFLGINDTSYMFLGQSAHNEGK